jgi:hypothetical protein
MDTKECAFLSLFDDHESWRVFASGQAEGCLSAVVSPTGGRGLRMDYDFHGGGGFVVMKKEIRFRMPETFEAGFYLRGAGPENHFEFKVADPGGTNVWRYLNQDFALPAEWKECRFNERNLPFAWGPAGGGAPDEIGAVEIVIAAGPGGKGFIELSLPVLENQTLRKPAAVRASSSETGFPAAAVFDPAHGDGWKAAVDDAQPLWEADFGRMLRFGGMVIGWPENLPPRSYHMEISDDGENWKSAHRADSALGALSHVALPGAEARHLRITFSNAHCAALRSLSFMPDAFSHTPNEFIHHIARDYPRGWFPRYWYREQSYWTPVGSPQGKRRALINEEGMVEVDEAGFSLEPFILTSAGLLTWADVRTQPLMAQGGAPVPSVVWENDDLWMEIQPWVDGRDDELSLHVTYRLVARKPAPGMKLAVAIRPFQVNPPWQAFRNLGGQSPIRRIECGSHHLTVDGRKVLVSRQADASGAAAFEQGGAAAFLAEGRTPPASQIDDASGLASAAMVWEIPSGAPRIEVTVSFPYFGKHNIPKEISRAAALAHWNQTLGGVEWSVPACAAPAFDAFRSAAGHILINRDGPAIQPGPRRYTRSWVRDCVIMGAALAKAGLPDALREFISWYAQFQRDDGFVPCVVDRDGVDWLVEHDSHGQFLWGVREVFRKKQDPSFLMKLFPHARKAAEYLIFLRSQRMTGEFERSADFGLLPASVSLEDEDTLDARSEFFGLLPESASHEGYLAHPVHSYWDDFWGVRGLEAAADLAQAAGFAVDAARWRAEAADFQRDVLSSLQKVIAEKKLNYIPGSVEWADFDPTATANAIGLLDFAGVLPQEPLEATLESYLKGHRAKHGGGMTWNNYSAYEIRIIGAFVRLGKREVAHELLEFFLSERRPAEWNQWPEITWKNPRSPGHLGDVPHTWIAAEYIFSLASIVADEREATDSLVLAGGMPWKWISEDGGFAVRNLPVRHGALDFQIHADTHSSIRVQVGGLAAPPCGGLSIAPPLPDGLRITGVEIHRGGPPIISSDGTSIRIESLPFSATLVLGVAIA